MTDMVKTQILAMGGADYALGLIWLTPAKGAGVRADCARHAREYKATHALYGKGIRQFALADTAGQPYQPTQRRPCYSAALAVATALREPTIFAAFALESGFYVVARVNNQFLPDGDRLFDDEAEAQAFFDRYKAATQWPTALRFAPGEWKIPSTPEAALDEILGSAPPTPTLRRPPLPPTYYYVAGGALAAAAVFAGWTYLFHHSAAPLRQRQHYEPLPTELVSFGTSARTCDSAAAEFHRKVWVPGWPVSQMTCDGAALTATLTRHPRAPRAWIAAIPEATVADDLETASVPATLSGTPQPSPLSPDQLANQADIVRRLRIIANNLGGTAPTFTMAPPRLIGTGDPPTGGPPWMRMTWTFTTTAPAEYWIPPIASLPATSLGSITQTTERFTVTGNTYVQP